ncbi:uncharacterized protein LOC121916978 [Sceloporus undulatus]|uniref:uncharacterized protein LOC121916978 n=1 Tax=Sceloporus undulatus TaxID=8520 RepID=UPI001C4BFA1A|nr:uncharacterized protein LOC121916978 [Sceloporus undulatus]
MAARGLGRDRSLRGGVASPAAQEDAEAWLGLPALRATSSTRRGSWRRTAAELERNLHFLQRQLARPWPSSTGELHYQLIMYPVLQNVQVPSDPSAPKPLLFLGPLPSSVSWVDKDGPPRTDLTIVLCRSPFFERPSPGCFIEEEPRGSSTGYDHREDDFVLYGKPHHRGRSGRKTSRHAKVATEEDSSSGGFSGLEEVEGKETHPKTSADVSSLEEEGARDTPDEDRDTPKEDRDTPKEDRDTPKEDGVAPKEVMAPIPEPKETPTKEKPHSPRVSILGPPHTLRPPCKETEVCDQTTSPILPPSPAQSRAEEVKIPAASSNPFLASVLPSCMRKPPTLEECEAVIRQLWNINHMQMQELMYLRSCLDDIYRTRRIPEDYMLAGHIGNSQTTRLPRMKNAPKQCRLLNPLPAAERSVLPALKQTLGNTFAERQKRAQAIQRKRLNRPAY